MVRGYLALVLAALTSYLPAPPGAIVHRQQTYLAGESMNAKWQAIISKVPVGKNVQQTFYQWYLSIYAMDAGTQRYRLKYQSPKDGIPLSKVTKANGADLWFPVAEASFAGSGELMGPGTQQLVVVSHEASADCGMSRIDVLFYDAAMHQVMPTLSVTNGCDLSASIVHEKDGDALSVTGPYYAKNAALCCPTKNKATALFRFHNGTWTQTPRYFTVRRSP
jgi:hypothetical protein